MAPFGLFSLFFFFLSGSFFRGLRRGVSKGKGGVWIYTYLLAWLYTYILYVLYTSLSGFVLHTIP